MQSGAALFAHHKRPTKNKLVCPAQWQDVCDSGVSAAYFFTLDLNLHPNPINPVPNSMIVPGSGTSEIFVSPLEIVADPLKNPLPTGTVS